MNREMTNNALKIMKYLTSHPCSKPFQNFDKEKDKDGTNYCFFLKDAKSLEQIRAELKTNQYKRLAEWYTDMQQILISVSKFSILNPYLYILAFEMNSLFEKRYNNLIMKYYNYPGELLTNLDNYIKQQKFQNTMNKKKRGRPRKVRDDQSYI